MTASTKTVVFIDPNVADWQDLVNGVEPGSLVFILDPQRDGISQITNKLAALTDINSVQIISHGGDGSLSLGSTQLNSDNLNGYSSQLQQWGKSLTATGDILLYGCDVAQGFVGKAFVQQISQLTGADVAASDDLTGSAALGGDWVLEYATGLIDAPLALQVQAMEAYTSVLPDYVVGGYYTNWSTYGRNFQVADIPANKLTHVFYGFTKIENGAVALTDSYADTQKTFGKYTWQQSDAGLAGNLAELKALKQSNPNLKTMMSVGGWTLSSPFSDAALTDSSRTKFASSAVQLMVKYGFDGLDIDWEYHVGGGDGGNINRPADKQNYNLLLQTLRQELNKPNQVHWKNISGNFLHIRNLDSNWNWVSSEGQFALNSADAPAKETVFGIDANSDGVIGSPSSLTLTGTSGNDILIGGTNNDVLTGAGGKDTLTGGLGSDKFVYQNLTDSLLANFDVITDFNATPGNDLFRVSTALAGFVDVGAVNTLDAAGIGAKLAAFGSNYAAQFSFGQRTFVAINDAIAGFNAANDAIIEVTGLTGTLNVNNFVIV